MGYRCIFFFFFQAEDGIRDLYVTGVQTCALPILDGRYAEKLWVDGPGLAHDPYVSVEMIEQGLHRAVMEGRDVFKFASIKMPESVAIALKTNRLTPAD